MTNKRSNFNPPPPSQDPNFTTGRPVNMAGQFLHAIRSRNDSLLRTPQAMEALIEATRSARDYVQSSIRATMTADAAISTVAQLAFANTLVVTLEGMLYEATTQSTQPPT